MPWCCTAREHLDDDHAAAAAWTKRLAGIGSSGWLALGVCNGKQLTGAGDVVGARGFGEQAVVADTMQAFWQHVNEEAADEPVGGERHLLVSIAALDAVILPLEGDALLVESNQSAVGDGQGVTFKKGLPHRGPRSIQADDARHRRVHPPLPYPRAAKRPASHSPLRPARQRRLRR